MATKMMADGTSEEIALVEGSVVDSLREVVGGWLEFVYFADGSILVINEEGKLEELPLNAAATWIAHMKKGISSDDCIVGNAVFVSANEARLLD